MNSDRPVASEEKQPIRGLCHICLSSNVLLTIERGIPKCVNCLGKEVHKQIKRCACIVCNGKCQNMAKERGHKCQQCDYGSHVK